MRKLIRILTVFFLSVLSVISPVYAEKVKTDSVTYDNGVFLEIISNSVSYRQYRERIIDVYVNRAVETEYGIRRTVSYILDSETDYVYLTFIGDLYGNIISTSYIVDNGNSIICSDIESGRENIVTYNANSWDFVMKCFKKQCTSYIYKLNAHLTDNGCSFYVGQSCNQLSPVGTPIAAILCKAGVWFACHTSIDKVCQTYATYEDICTL